LDTALKTLRTLAVELELPLGLEELLQRALMRTGQLLDCTRASVRLFDATRTRLFLGARLGEPVHEIPWEQQPGEGLLGWVAREGKPLLTGDAEHDPRYLARAGMREPIRSFLGMPIHYQGQCVGVLSVVHAEPGRFDERHLALAHLVAALCAPHLEVARLGRLARLDPLTGSLRPERLAELIPVGADPARQLTVLMVDVDGFTALNARDGREAGDEVLRTSARVLAGVLRVGDAVVRYGDDAFVLVVDGVGLLTASRIGERVRSAIGSARIVVPGCATRATVSVGVAERKEGESQPALLARAEAALAEARKRGDSVCLSRQ
jgi:diguanylate cyclase (GGDEF)-like protein